MLLRGFAEFKNNEEGAQLSRSYLQQMQDKGMTVQYAQLTTPNDNLLVRWYNPIHYRSFKVSK